MIQLAPVPQQTRLPRRKTKKNKRTKKTEKSARQKLRQHFKKVYVPEKDHWRWRRTIFGIPPPPPRWKWTPEEDSRDLLKELHGEPLDGWTPSATPQTRGAARTPRKLFSGKSFVPPPSEDANLTPPHVTRRRPQKMSIRKKAPVGWVNLSDPQQLPVEQYLATLPANKRGVFRTVLKSMGDGGCNFTSDNELVYMGLPIRGSNIFELIAKRVGVRAFRDKQLIGEEEFRRCVRRYDTRTGSGRLPRSRVTRRPRGAKSAKKSISPSLFDLASQRVKRYGRVHSS